MILFFGAEFTALKIYNGVIPPTAIAKGIIQQERYIIAFSDMLLQIISLIMN
jgi:hypothetical protein